MGFTASAVGSGAPIINNPLAYSNIGNCRGEVPTGYIQGGYATLIANGGLPGMKGGRRQSRRQSRRQRKQRQQKKQTGGRYGFEGADLSVVNGPSWGAAMNTISRVPCEASYTPLPPAGENLNMRNGALWSGADNVPKGVIPPQFGGALSSLPAPFADAFNPPSPGSPTGGVPASLVVPTARYEDLPAGEPGIRSAAGTNLSIHRPLDWAGTNPACLKTGGGRRRSRKAKRSSKAKKSKRSPKAKRSSKAKRKRSN
jgi:hypothetical protein